MPFQPVPACLPRSRETLEGLVSARDVEKNPDYQPGGGFTWCNKYVRDLLADLGLPFPAEVQFAHQQIDYLSGPRGSIAGWDECEPGEAQAHANQGRPVLACYRNPKTPPAGHSHIALLVPADTTLRVYITQAGARNYANTSVDRGFGKLPVRYFWHV